MVSDAALLLELGMISRCARSLRLLRKILETLRRDENSTRECHFGGSSENGRYEIWRLKEDALACING